MKKIIFAAVVLLALGGAQAQTNTSNNMQTPSSVTNQFGSDYPNSQATWSRDGNNYRADYMDGSSNRSVTYDRNGKVMSRDEMVTRGNYPSGISDYYSSTYPNENYDVWSSTDANGQKSYYTKRNSETIWFDQSGKRNKAGRNKSTGKTQDKSMSR